MHTKLIENRNLARVGGIVSHYRQPQCVADVDLWLSLGVRNVRGGSGGSKASEARWVQAEGGALDWPWHATNLGGNTMAKKMRLGQHRHSPQCVCSTLRRPQLQLGRHRRVATICTQLWRKLNAIAMHSSGHKREIARERGRERWSCREGGRAAAFMGDFKF